jgi:hypothetical protein
MLLYLLQRFVKLCRPGAEGVCECAEVLDGALNAVAGLQVIALCQAHAGWCASDNLSFLILDICSGSLLDGSISSSYPLYTIPVRYSLFSACPGPAAAASS